MSKKKQGGLKPQKITRQKAKMLLRGAEIDGAMLGSLEEKMQKGGDAKRIVKAQGGKEKMQAYKLGGWTHSE